MHSAIIHNLRWQSDWNGDEVGYPEYNVVGLYTSDELRVDVYIDTESQMVLAIMPHYYDDEL